MLFRWINRPKGCSGAKFVAGTRLIPFTNLVTRLNGKTMVDKALCVNCNLLYEPDELRCCECRAPLFIVERKDSDAIATDSDDIPW